MRTARSSVSRKSLLAIVAGLLFAQHAGGVRASNATEPRTAWPAYVLATYTGWTRVTADEHDTADVLAGAAVGIASSFILAKRENVNVSALLDGDTVGLRIAGQF
jgi:hypothetical protein